jgi:hypothetical protein
MRPAPSAPSSPEPYQQLSPLRRDVAGTVHLPQGQQHGRARSPAVGASTTGSGRSPMFSSLQQALWAQRTFGGAVERAERGSLGGSGDSGVGPAAWHVAHAGGRDVKSAGSGSGSVDGGQRSARVSTSTLAEREAVVLAAYDRLVRAPGAPLHALGRGSVALGR